jgi:phytoene synthase
MSDRELRAAGITEPALVAAYTASRRINAGHGRTYFLATRLLPPATRPAIHALYGFARVVDDIVDGPTEVAAKAAALHTVELALGRALDSDVDSTDHGNADRTGQVLRALADTVARYRIDRDLFAPFLTSMRMDLQVSSYASIDDLDKYVYGSAAVIGLQLLPVLGTVCPPAEAAPYATGLGVAFQLTNFLRDVGEDLDRGRVYLPADELVAFRVDTDRLRWVHHSGRRDPAVRRALAHLVAYTYAVYRRAEPGIALLQPQSRPCVATAATLYRGILDRIVEADYDILGRRVAVPRRRRLRVALPGLVHALAARTRSH